MDNCSQCDALCCRVFEVKKPSKFIPIKQTPEACGHLVDNECGIYCTPDADRSVICHEYSCFWVWPIVTEWVQKNNVHVSRNSSDSSADHPTIVKILDKARMYVAKLLDIYDTATLDQVPESEREEAYAHVEYILNQCSPAHAREVWDSFLFPERWFTESEKQLNQRKKEALMRYLKLK